MFSPRFPSPGRTAQMEREHHVSPQNKRSRPHHFPAQAPLWILSQFKLLLSPSVPLLRCLSLPGHLVLIRPLPSCWLWVLLTKFFHPFPHPRGSTTSTEDSTFSDAPEEMLDSAEGRQGWNWAPTIPEDTVKGSRLSSVACTFFLCPCLLKNTRPLLSLLHKPSDHRQTQYCDK